MLPGASFLCPGASLRFFLLHPGASLHFFLLHPGASLRLFLLHPGASLRFFLLLPIARVERMKRDRKKRYEGEEKWMENSLYDLSINEQ